MEWKDLERISYKEFEEILKAHVPEKWKRTIIKEFVNYSKEGEMGTMEGMIQQIKQLNNL